MSQYPAPTPYQAPPPPAPRNRRAGRSAAHRTRKKSQGPLAWWQGAVLAALLFTLIWQVLRLGQAQGQLKRLEQERQEAQERYELTVKSHQVRYRELIEKYAEEYNLNPAYVSAIIKQESSFDPRAVSSKGARGLMQFMPDTFDWVKKNCGYKSATFDDIYQPEISIKMGCYLLNYITQKIGTDDPVLVACAYHAGWGTIPTWLQNYSTDGQKLTIAQIPKSDTRTYAGRVLNSYAIYLQHYY